MARTTRAPARCEISLMTQLRRIKRSTYCWGPARWDQRGLFCSRKPIDPPINPRAAQAIVKIGEIHIPKIGLVHPVYEGVTLTVIDHGPGHWPGSAVPGQLGNSVFAGHRVTHSHPFRRIHEMAPGDDIIFKMQNGTFTYKMTGHQIVTPKDVHIVNPTTDATVTLFACHPPGSARQR